VTDSGQPAQPSLESQLTRRRLLTASMVASVLALAGGAATSAQSPSPGDELYPASTEREVAFKLLAAHAVVDGHEMDTEQEVFTPFLDFLAEDPVGAAASLNFKLDDPEDIEYFQSLTQENWDAIRAAVIQVRPFLNLEVVTNSW
jgi:hypothetical protein